MSEVYSLHESLGYLLSVAARTQERRLESGLRELGLTRTGWCVLLAVGCERLAQPSDIAAFVRIDRTAGSRALRQLEEVGMIARKVGKTDRRTTEVRLTSKGQAALAKGIPLARANNAAMDALLDGDERVCLENALDKLIGGTATPLARL